VVHYPSDYYYIPAKHRTAFIGLSMHFVHQRVMCELAVANIVGILTDGDSSQYMWTEGSWLWDPDRHNRTLWGLSSEGLTGGRYWLHAVKQLISQYGREVTQWWNSLSCTQ
jgi:hypothetical protein